MRLECRLCADSGVYLVLMIAHQQIDKREVFGFKQHWPNLFDTGQGKSLCCLRIYVAVVDAHAHCAIFIKGDDSS